MAQRGKGKEFYEISAEKPFTPFHLMGVGGSAGVIVSFFILLLMGNYMDMPLDALIFFMLLAVFLGFGVGTMLTWVFIRFFGGFLQLPFLEMSLENQKTSFLSEAEPSPIIGREEEKGKSVDYVFPEFSPDKQ